MTIHHELLERKPKNEFKLRIQPGTHHQSINLNLVDWNEHKFWGTANNNCGDGY